MTSAARLAGRAIALLVAGAATALIGPPALAHTDLVSVDPRDGAGTRQLPNEISLEFTDPMDPSLSTLRLQQKGVPGRTLELANGASPTILVASVPDALAPASGTTTRWTITYRVVSRDGHPVTGTSEFVVRMPESTTTAPDPEASPTSPAAQPSDGDEGSASSEPRSTESRGGSWPLVAIGVGTLLLLGVAVAAVMRLVGRGADR